MIDKTERHERILVIYANPRGFAFALMEGVFNVKDKGQYKPSPISNTDLMTRVKWLTQEHQPDMIVMENMRASIYRKRERTIKFARRVRAYAKDKKIGYCTYSRSMIRHLFKRWKAKTKYEIALVICDNIPAFKNIMYEKLVYPKTVHYRTGIFDAVSLGVTHFFLSTEK